MSELEQGTLTYQDFLTFPDDGNRYEIIDGARYMTPSPTPRHQRALRDLGIALINFTTERNLGEVLFAPIDVVLSESNVVEPDLVFIRKDRKDIITDKFISGPPDLIVEVLSKSTRKTDLRAKMRLYERFAVGEYWIVDPEAESIQVHELRHGELDKIGEYRSGESVRSALFHDFELAVDEVFKSCR